MEGKYPGPWTASMRGVRWPGTWAGQQIEEAIRKYSLCRLFNNLTVADAGDKCIWF